MPTWNIWDCIRERWDDDQAEEYVREIQYAVERVDNPSIGQACDEIRPGYQKHAAGAHTLYYRIARGDVIDVVRVLHQRMDVDRHFD